MAVHLARQLCLACERPDICATPSQKNGVAYDDFYGDIGALKCLLQKRGDMALLTNSVINGI